MFEITYTPSAASEYADAVEWYKERSNATAEKFLEEIQKKLHLIALNPRLYRNLFKKYFETSVKGYPYSIVYIIEEDKNRIIVTAIYHHKRNPRRNIGVDRISS